MNRTWTIIDVRNVASSCAWYQSLLGLPPKGPAHDYFGQIVDGDGTVLLCLPPAPEMAFVSLSVSKISMRS
jgi:hypothetical protein